MKRYDSKIGPEIFIPLTLVFLLLFLVALMSKNWIGLLILSAAATFIIHTIRNTFYIISDGILSIRCGKLYRSEIEINSITRLKEVIDIFSAPATSVYRLEISF
jgi:Bacterial PH domain